MFTIKKLPEKLKDPNGCCPSVMKGKKFINPVSNYNKYEYHLNLFFFFFFFSIKKFQI